MNSAVIVAGGSGRRFDSDIPKQFIKIDNREILSYSVKTFSAHPHIDEVIIVCPHDWIEHVVKNYEGFVVVNGGETRRQSSLSGVNACHPDTENILIHDAARPLISHEMISNCLNALKNYSCAVPFTAVNDSTVIIENDTLKYLDRNNLKHIQTPQGFKAFLIREALETKDDGTDDLSMVMKLRPDSTYYLFPGEENNFKITTEKDLIRMKFLLML